MRNYILTILFLFSFLCAAGQPKCVFTHYSPKDGLSQNSIMNIVQDRNGVLWFSTWDGINRFNGYDFKVYKSQQGSDLTLSNNRVDLLAVDSYNYIWLQTYDNHIYRFDQKTEKFEWIPIDGANGNMPFSSINVLTDGVVWLLYEHEGAIRVKTNPQVFSVTTRAYAVDGRGGSSAHVYDVHLDKDGNEWLLTSNGLLKIIDEEENPVSYFVNSSSHKEGDVQNFYTCCQYGDELCFGSDGGRVWCYRKDEVFRLWELPIVDKVVSIDKIKENELLITTERQGFMIYHPDTDEISVYNKSNCPEFPSDNFCSVFVDSKQEVWFEMTEWGEVCHFNPFTGTFKKEKVQLGSLGADRSFLYFHVCEDVNGNLWVHPRGGGLSWYDRENNRLLPFYNAPDSSDWRFSNEVNSMFSDGQGTLWLATNSRGLEKITFPVNQFKFYARKDIHDLNANIVRSLFEDDDHRIWMGRKNGKIEIYTADFKYVGYLGENGTITTTGKPLFGSAYCIMQDTSGVIWIATKGEGVFMLEKSGTGFKVTRFKHNNDDTYSLSHNSAYWLHEDRHGRIWVGTFGGGLNYIQKTPEGKYLFINYSNNLKRFPYDQCYRVRHIASDNQGNIWVGTTDGVLHFKDDFKEPESIVFQLYTCNPDDPTTLGNNNVYRTIVTSSGDIYMATFGGGLNKLVSVDDQGKAVFKPFTNRDGLPNDILLTVEEDDDGNLWMSTESGVSKFIPSEQRFENYNERDFGENIRFEEATSLNLGNTTKLLFGTSDGVLCFQPELAKKSDYVPPIVLGTLKVANQTVVPGENNRLLKQSLNSTEHLVLSHNDDIISLSFFALDMAYPENIHYAYRLDGLDKEWNYVDKQHTATYTNLKKGDYTFRVRSTNSDGVWVENERVLKITVRPSFWETPMVVVLYVLAFLGVLLGGVYILFTIYRLKHEVSVEQQITDIKLRFFTNISHELRTPLTLIAGPVEYVLQKKDLSDDVREQLQVVGRNTDRMLRMVNQILDFRKIQKNKMKLRVEQIDVVPFVHHIMDNFMLLAEDHHIDFVFESEKPSLKLWVDTDKLEKIVFNLLSNAFKYTPQGKMITLFIHENENSVAIGVQDLGIGISESKKASLFVRFENLLDKNLFNQQSSGIGLSMVKELVELHRATIRVDSKEGEGSCFTVELQKGREHYDDTVEFIVSDDVEVLSDETSENPEESEALSGEKKNMLLVEDNLELRFFLRSIFASDFNVIEAVNGAEGLEKALKFVPDMIISDIMMPEKDGITMAQELRANMATSHIPVVLLTAKTDIDSKLEGMELGADDYITKPFSATYLKARVENLLAQRVKLQQLYLENLMNILPDYKEEPPQQPEMSSNDRKFMDKLTEQMEKNMDNGDLIVDDLVKELAVSRSIFFKKLKTLTGLAPVEFIKEMRVKRAAQLIETGDYNMTQIAYMVGINDPRYFSKCFKQRFGMTPTEYKENAKNKTKS